MAKSDKKADKKAEKSKAAKPSAAPAKAKLLASSKEILAKDKKTLKSNGKTPAKRANVDSSDESSDSSSEDEKPKKTVVSSDSDDSPEEKKPASAPAKGKGKMESSDSSDASSSEESSSDEDGDVKMVAVQPAKDKKATDKTKTKAAKPAVSPAKPVASPAKAKLPTSSKEILAKAAPKGSNGKVAESSDESSDSSSEDEQPKKTASTSDSDESSDDEEPASVPAVKTAKGQVESNDSSDSSGDESSSDETEAQPAKGTKRKAEAEPAAPPKKVKLADGEAAPAASTEETKSIFVGRLSWNVDNDWLAQEFASCGEVVSAHVQTDRATGKSRGFGYVHFASADAVDKALEMNGKEIDGRPVNIDKSTPPDKNAVRENRAKSFGDTKSPASSVLFVGNLSFGVNEDQLWEVFGEHGDVKSVRVPTDRESGRPKGFAYVEFSVLDAAKTAHEQLQGYELDGRNLRLDFSQPRDSAGGGGGRGGGRGGFGDRGRGGFGDRGRGRGGFGGDRGRGGFGGDRGFRGRGRGGDRGGRGGGRGRGGPRTGAVAQFEGSKITFD